MAYPLTDHALEVGLRRAAAQYRAETDDGRARLWWLAGSDLVEARAAILRRMAS